MSLTRITAALYTAALLAGCGRQATDPPAPVTSVLPVTPGLEKKGDAKRLPVGKNVSLEIDGARRRVLINAYVCLNKGQLEQLLTKKLTKEHEAVLAADIDAADVKTALLAAGAEEGHPIRFDKMKVQPPEGMPIKIYLEYQDQGKTVRVPAQQWVRSARTKKDLDSDWVFAGSRLIDDPLDKNKPPFFAANYGDVICVSNFETALLDVPFSSSKDNEDLDFEANTERIPPLGTPVLVILEPAPPDKAK
jgi:hypothetical protein